MAERLPMATVAASSSGLWRASDLAARASQGRTLRAIRPLIALVMVVPPVLGLAQPSAIPTPPRVVAALLWVACLWPAWQYAGLPSARRPPLPFVPLLGVVYALYFSLQLVVGVDNALASAAERPVILDPSRDYFDAAWFGLVGWLCVLATIQPRGRTRRRSPFAIPQLQMRAIKPLAFKTVYVGLLLEPLIQLGVVPTVLRGVVTFVANVALAAIALLVGLWARRLLTAGETTRLALCFVAVAALRLGSGALAQILILMVIALLAAWTGGRRLGVGWFVAGAIVLAGAVSVKGVLADFRSIAWFNGVERPLPERVVLVSSLVADKARRVGVAETVISGWEFTAGRSAATDLFADVIRRTPRPVPYWGGETYLSLVGAFVPRILWPNKPVKDLGQQFGHRYGYLGDFDRTTSINFPYLIEFYANFGELGVIAGMLVVGLLLRALQSFVNVPGQGPAETALGLVLLVPFLNIESDFSLMFGGLFLNMVCLIVVVAAARRYVAGGSGRARATSQAGAPSSTGLVD